VDQVSQPRKFALQDLLVEKQQGSQRLILGRRADVSFGETRKKGANLGLGQGFGMALAVEDDEAPNPSDVGLLGARAIVTGSQAFPDLVKKTRGLVCSIRRHVARGRRPDSSCVSPRIRVKISATTFRHTKA
jgi:hypothetical protein